MVEGIGNVTGPKLGLPDGTPLDGVYTLAPSILDNYAGVDGWFSDVPPVYVAKPHLGLRVALHWYGDAVSYELGSVGGAWLISAESLIGTPSAYAMMPSTALNTPDKPCVAGLVCTEARRGVCASKIKASVRCSAGRALLGSFQRVRDPLTYRALGRRAVPAFFFCCTGPSRRSLTALIKKYQAVDCGLWCATTPGCKYFAFGGRDGACYWEKTESALCIEGWYACDCVLRFHGSFIPYAYSPGPKRLLGAPGS